MSIDDLNRRFAIPDTLRFEEGRDGLARATITHAHATGEVYLHGAHVTAWQPSGERPVLWMSERSHFEADKPIRGGVPICFPWFGAKAGDAAAPSHGLARLRDWRVEATSQGADGVAVRLSALVAPYAVTLDVVFGRELRMSLGVRNPSASPATFEVALHTYFAVSNIRDVRVTGLESTSYLDQLAGRQRFPASGSPITFAGETDRIYLDAGDSVAAADKAWGRTIRVSKTGSRSTVVWNPWDAKAARMPDFGDDEWPHMLCIETANVGEHAVTLPPGGAHEMATTLSVIRNGDTG